MTLLQHHTDLEHVDMVKLLLSTAINVNAQDDTGMTALHIGKDCIVSIISHVHK